VRVLYLDCYSGISGDMLLAALVDLGVDHEELRSVVRGLGLGADLSIQRVRRGSFAAVKADVMVPSEPHVHRHVHDIEIILERSGLPGEVVERSQRVFRMLAEAEGRAHGTDPGRVHFHEVGAVDAIVDVVASLYALRMLRIERVVSSPVSVGGGVVQMEHGRVRAPAPGTSYLLEGVPIVGGPVEAELCTPTGAALLRELCREFGPMPPMVLERVGAGAGSRDFPNHPNLLRAFLGHVPEPVPHEAQHVFVLETSIDDVPGEYVGFAVERLLEAGALDIQVLAGAGKKNRPSFLVRVVCPVSVANELEEVLFEETGTLGIRRIGASRHVLPRYACTVETEFGPVSGKIALLPSGKELFAPEYESCRAVAVQCGVAIREVFDAARAAYRAGKRR
jgi:uncharacterized protein (TIGR00299 family) protein